MLMLDKRNMMTKILLWEKEDFNKQKLSQLPKQRTLLEDTLLMNQATLLLWHKQQMNLFKELS